MEAIYVLMCGDSSIAENWMQQHKILTGVGAAGVAGAGYVVRTTT